MDGARSEADGEAACEDEEFIPLGTGGSGLSSSFAGGETLETGDGTVCGVTGAGLATGVTDSVLLPASSEMFVFRVSFTSWLTDLLVTFRPRTTSERRISGTVSPGVVTTDPGKGGKLEAAKSNFGGAGALVSIKGTGLVL